MCIECNILPKFMNNKAKYMHPYIIASVLKFLITLKFLDLLKLF